MKNITSNLRYWSTGALVALCGVTCARVIAPTSTGQLRVVLTLGGQLVALSGLFIICLGVRRRIKQATAAQTPENT